MNRRANRSRGYSLSELLTIVAIVGLVSMVAIPAFMQLLPQYRLRSAASEIASSMRMVRAKAVSTRSNWRVGIDPVAEAYILQRSNGSSWVAMGDNGRPIPSGQPQWRTLSAVNITGSSTVYVTFTRDGSATAGQAIVLATTNRFVAYNRYTINVATSGSISIVPSKV